MMSILSDFKKREKTPLWAGICLMTSLCFMLFLYAPLEMYFYNKYEFWFDVYDLFPLLIVLWALGVSGSIVVLMAVFVCFPKLYRFVLPTTSIVFLSTYIQGNFLVGNLPIMDGTEIDWEEYSSGRVQSVILWVVVASLVLWIYKVVKKEKFAELVRLISTCMTLMLLVTIVSVAITTEGFEKKLDICPTVKNEYVFSEDTNFVILVLDSVDSQTLYEMMEREPEYKDIFSDFTYYRNTVGAYPLTQFAIPHIISGIWYENERPYDEYWKEAYADSPLFELLQEQNYRMGIYEYEIPFVESMMRFDNVIERNSRVSSYKELAKLEIKLVGLRYVPYDLKRFCEFKMVEFASLREMDDVYAPFLSDNQIYYSRLVESEVSRVPEKVFKFTHIDGAHVPFEHDKNMQPIENGTYEDACAASIKITQTYLDKMKAAEVYDNSVIIVMADHGLDGKDLGAYTGRQNPILLVKGIGEEHEMQLSEAPISYEDLQKGFVELLSGELSTEIFDYQEGDERARRFLYCIGGQEHHMYECIQTEHASFYDIPRSGNEYILEE